MALLGLIPGTHSSGTEGRQGSIIKTDNARARWMMVEAAQHFRLPPKVSASLAKRQQGQSNQVWVLG